MCVPRALLLALLLLAALAAPASQAQSRRDRPDRDRSPASTRRDRPDRDRSPASTRRDQQTTSARQGMKPPAGRATGRDTPAASQPRSTPATRTGTRPATPGPAARPGPTPPAAARPGPTPPAATRPGPTPPAAARPGPTPPTAARPAAAPAAPVMPTAPAAGQWLAAADSSYTAGAYQAALRGYREATARGQVPEARKQQVALRLARCLLYTRQWAAALAEAERLPALWPGTVWEARARAWLMEVHLSLPDGHPAAAPSAGEEAEPGAARESRALASGEVARRLFARLRPTLRDAGEESDLSADLARLLFRGPTRRWAAAGEWRNPDDPFWRVEDGAAHDTTWPPPKRALHLLAVAERLAPAERKPLVQLARALGVRAYHRTMHRLAGPARPGTRGSAYPYRDVDPATLLEAFLRENPGHPEALPGRLRLAAWREEDGRPSAAAELLEALVKEQPDSRWARDAAARLARLRRPELALQAPLLPRRRPGQPVQLELRARGVELVRFTAQRLRLEHLVQDTRVLNRTRPGMNELFARLGRARGIRQVPSALVGDAVSWEHRISLKDPLEPASGPVSAPLREPGAWLVEAEGGGTTAAALLVLSELDVVRVVDSRRTLVLVTDGGGRPVEGATVLIRELYREGEEKLAISAARAVTAEDGLATKPHSPRGTATEDVTVLAWKDGHYALLRDGTVPRPTVPTAGDETALVVSARRSYRPGQEVSFRVLAARLRPREEGPAVREVLAEHRLRAVLRRPGVEPIVARSLTTSEAGTAHGVLTLPSDAAPGEWLLEARWATREGAAEEVRGATRLLVTEDRPRDPVVTIAADREGTPRVGEPLSARVTVRRSTGAPVAGARVRYSIRRTATPREPADPPAGSATGAAVASGGERSFSGELVTDARGQVLIALDTSAAPGIPPADLAFTIAAEVADSERRVAAAPVVLAVPWAGYAAALSAERGFSTPGSPVAIHLATRGPGGAPVAAAGQLRIRRLVAGISVDGGPEVHSAPAATGPGGTLSLAWRPPGGGAFVARWEGRDDAGRPVAARALLYVAGEELATALVEGQVLVAPERAAYSPGETARVLVATREPVGALLCIGEVRGELAAPLVAQHTTRARILEFPLERPGSYRFAATGPGGSGWSGPVECRETGRGLQVELTTDSARYEPGARVTARLRTMDAQGRPVPAEVSLSVVEATEVRPVGEGAVQQAEAKPPLAVTAAGPGTALLDAAGTDETAPQPGELAAWRFPARLGTIQGAAALARLPPWGAELPEQAPPGGGVAAEVRPAQAEARPGEPDGGTGEAVAAYPGGGESAFWAPAIQTDGDGRAEVRFALPEKLAAWRLRATAWSRDAQFAEVEREVTAHKELQVRLLVPRFFQERDEVVITVAVGNRSGREQQVRLTLELEGAALVLAGASPAGPAGPRPVHLPRPDLPAGTATTPAPAAPETPPTAERELALPDGEEARVEWRLLVERPGEVRLRAIARGQGVSDAAERTVRAVPHGLEQRTGRAGWVPPAAPGRRPRTARVELPLPPERSPDAGALVVEVSTSLLGSVLSALQELAEGAGGGTEQTVSRFVPAALVAQALGEAAPKDEEASTNGRETAEHPGPAALLQAAALRRAAAEGTRRLAALQNGDGSWGWWRGDAGSTRMTAIAVQGLAAARGAGIPVPAETLERGLRFLERRLAGERLPHDVPLIGWTLTLDRRRAPAAAAALLERSFPTRERLTPCSLALLAMALRNGGRTAEAAVCLQALEQAASVDAAAGTCSWRGSDGAAWHWFNNPVEATATALRALLSSNPRHRLAGPAARWLAGARAGGAWSTSRETAVALHALSDYTRLNPEAVPSAAVTVEAGGVRRRLQLEGRPGALPPSGRVVVPMEALGAGGATVDITVEGGAPLYYAASARYFTGEEGIRATGGDLRLVRRYFRLTRAAPGTPGERAAADGFRREPLRAGASVLPGTLLEVELALESRHPLDHLVVEDRRPAGCDPVGVQSGAPFAGGLCSNVEVRDSRTVFFITRLPQGRSTWRYRLRAERAGVFHALPATVHAAFAPRVRAGSDEAHVTISEAEAVTGP